MLPVHKMADQNLPGYQPRNFADTDYVKQLSFSALKVSCLHFVTSGVILLGLF